MKQRMAKSCLKEDYFLDNRQMANRLLLNGINVQTYILHHVYLLCTNLQNELHKKNAI